MRASRGRGAVALGDVGGWAWLGGNSCCCGSCDGGSDCDCDLVVCWVGGWDCEPVPWLGVVLAGCDCVPPTVWEPEPADDEGAGTPLVCGAAVAVAIFSASWRWQTPDGGRVRRCEVEVRVGWGGVFVRSRTELVCTRVVFSQIGQF